MIPKRAIVTPPRSSTMQLKFFEEAERAGEAQGHTDPETGQHYPRPLRDSNIIAIDFGKSRKLMATENGTDVYAPKKPFHDILIDAFERGLDVVTESSTIGTATGNETETPLGSFGVSPMRVAQIVAAFPDRKINLVPTRVTRRFWQAEKDAAERLRCAAEGIEFKTRKQRRKVRDKEWKKKHPTLEAPKEKKEDIPDDEAVRILWRIAVQSDQHLRTWRVMTDAPERGHASTFVQLRHAHFPDPIMDALKKIVQRVVLSGHELAIIRKDKKEK